MSRRSEYIYRPAWWVPGPHAQTLWPKFFRRSPAVELRLERWDTPDGDFVELHRMSAAPGSPRLFLLHGLEGTVRSHYVGGFFHEAHRRGWAADLLIFRGCGTEPNRAPRFYHSDETSDLAFALDRVLSEHAGAPIVLAGVSLGGNVLLKYLGEHGTSLPAAITAAAAISVPFDLERGARHISQGFSRVYDRHFLRSLREKAEAKLHHYPRLFDIERLRQARNIYEFDDAVTAPVHGFADARDYYSQSSALRWLPGIARPTLLLSSRDDPFLPVDVLNEVETVARENRNVHVEFTNHGGHVGFVEGRLPGRARYYAEWRACEFLDAELRQRGIDS